VSTAGVRNAGGSVVRVVGTACGLGIEGSGWVAAPGIVVTNAHVVAGETDTRVEVGGAAPGLAAVALDFDPHDDIAVLRVPGLAAHRLTIAPAAPPGASGAILGYPQDGPFNAQPSRIGQTRDVETENAYGQGPVLRSVTELRGLVRPGNSGGPVVSSSGQVLAMVFAAIATPRSRHGGFAVPNALIRAQLRVAGHRSAAVGTGACAG
jgi:S1-C subfamily serine protease